MPDRITLLIVRIGNARRTSRTVLHQVTGKSDFVAPTVTENRPVVRIVTGRRPLCLTVKKAVGDGNSAGRLVSSDDELPSDHAKRDLVDPDQISIVESDAVTTPNVLRVDLVNPEIVQDDILLVRNTQSSTLIPASGVIPTTVLSPATRMGVSPALS